MRKLLLIGAIAMAASPLIATASEGKHGGKERDGIYQMFIGGEKRDAYHQGKGMELTQEQRATIGKALHEYNRDVTSLGDTYIQKLPKKDLEAFEAEVQKLHDLREASIRSAVTPEQIKQIEGRQAKRKAKRQEWEEFKVWRDAQKKN